jgi:Ni,Fe-hydrogenase III component G
MDDETTLQTARQLLAQWTQATTTPEPHRLDVIVSTADLVAAVTALRQARWGYLSAITGLDLGVEANTMEVLYHFCAGKAIVTLRVRVSRMNPGVPSICAIIPSATLFERELGEMFGITVVNTPNSDRLYLPDDWPQGAYPMRKDFEVSA